jgi:hypothetical protein
VGLVGNLKQRVRRLWPRGYYGFAKLKQLIAPLRFDRYFDGIDANLQVPERCVVALLPYLPAHIDQVLIIGCASGRDFIPFQNTHKLWGVDLVPFERINWRCETSRLRYDQCRAEELPALIERENLADTLVYSSGTMMYLSARHQRRLYQALQARGCRNFIFQEPPHWHPEFGAKAANLCLQLPYEELRQIAFREGSLEPIAFVRLDGASLPQDID